MKGFSRFLGQQLKRRRTRQFIMYIILGGTAALLELSVLYFLTDILGIFYIASVVISYPCGVTTNFFLNKYFNFRNRSRKIVRQVSIFIIVNLIALGFTVALMFVFVELLHIWYMTARVVTLAMVFFFSFTMHRNVTFRD